MEDLAENNMSRFRTNPSLLCLSTWLVLGHAKYRDKFARAFGKVNQSNR